MPGGTPVLLAEKLFKGIARLGFARVVFGFGHKFAPGHFKVFTIIGHLLVEHRFGAAVAALIRCAWLVTHAVQTHLQIGAANARFRTPRCAGESIFPAAFPAMSRQGHGIIVFLFRRFCQPLVGKHPTMGLSIPRLPAYFRLSLETTTTLVLFSDDMKNIRIIEERQKMLRFSGVEGACHDVCI